MNKSIEGRPVLVQGSESPIIVGVSDTDENLLCEGCGKSVLVEHYYPKCVVGIGIQCFRCGHVTLTPSLPAGDVFPKPVLTLGDKGKFVIVSPVNNNKNVVITCDQEIASVGKKTLPSNSGTGNFELSIESIDLISLELNLLSGGNFTKPLKAARKAFGHGHKHYKSNPLAWSIEFIKKQLNNNKLHMHEESIVAMCMIQGCRVLIHRWKNHAHITHIAKELCGSFHHTFTQMIVAAYLSDKGNNIAIYPPPPNQKGRSADLYVRPSANAKEKLFIEIKTPQDVEWPNFMTSFRRMKKIVEKCLNSAKGQIGTKKPGILIIGTTCLSPNFLVLFNNATESVLRKKGRKYSGVAGIGIVGLNEVSLKTKESTTDLDLSTSYKVSMVKNTHYFKENPMKIT